MTLQQKLEEIKERAEKATDGPWLNDERIVLQDSGIQPHICYSYTADGYSLTDKPIENAEFIAHARTDVPLLLKALAKCIEQRDELLDRHDYARKSWDRELKAIFEGDE
jgi:hypothetical protein